MGSKTLFERSAFKGNNIQRNPQEAPQPGDNDWILGKGLIDKITLDEVARNLLRERQGGASGRNPQ